jgi:hypothetical protein
MSAWQGMQHTSTITTTRKSVRYYLMPRASCLILATLLAPQVESLPTVLLYPRGAPGLLRYCGRSITAEGLLKAINTCRKRVKPDTDPLELRGVGPPLAVLQQEASSGAAAVDVAEAGAGAASEATVTAGAGAAGAAAKRQAAVLIATTQPQPLDSYTGGRCHHGHCLFSHQRHAWTLPWHREMPCVPASTCIAQTRS